MSTKLLKVKGIVVKEVPYGESDKIITILTDSLGLIAAIAKGAKKTKSALLASSQYLVYSEFVLFKGTSFYHVNSAETINVFYNLKIDFDKLEKIYPLTRMICYLMNEDIDSEEILKTFLNTLFFIDEGKKNLDELVNIFRIRLIKILGFFPNIKLCSNCKENIDEKSENKVYYDYVSNIFLCEECSDTKSSRMLMLPKPCYKYITYIAFLDITKIFGITLNENYINYLDKFGQALIDCINNSY